MFQTFDDIADPTLGPARLKLLRAELARLGLTGFIVPRADEHQGEYVPPSAERLAWISGFTGSAGTVVVTGKHAAIFIDGRYSLQVRDQVDTTAFTPVGIEETPVIEWLASHVTPDDRIGYDPKLHTISGIKRFEDVIGAAGASLVALPHNPIDAVWFDRPPAPVGPVVLQPIEFAGESVTYKLARLSKVQLALGASFVVLTQPDSIAWTFNIRGSDVPHTPVALSYAIVPAEGRPSLFIDLDKLGPIERSTLSAQVELEPFDAFWTRLDLLGATAAKVMIDPAWVSSAIAQRLVASGASLIEADDPCRLPKAIKNAAEIEGARQAHVRDGVAVTRFLVWFDAHATSGSLDEIGVCEALERFRTGTGVKVDGERGRLRDLSFPTISGSGPNGAIVHYRVSAATNRRIDQNSLFLLDSGAQYRDGTTDITRTTSVGQPSDEMRDRFTRVLKGMVAIATARFPKGTTGHQLDALARASLWAAGLDYDHGTGHGIGSYLSVHEGPQGISKRLGAVLEPGMIISDEPGYYKTGAWGIRIENLLLVCQPEMISGGERPMLGFETLTLVPIDRRLIELSLLTRAEVRWIDAYHARVAAEIGPHLDQAEAEWLQRATAPL